MRPAPCKVAPWAMQAMWAVHVPCAHLASPSYRCGPCQMLAPTLSALSKRMQGKIQVVKIDSDKYGALASQYNIQVSSKQLMMPPPAQLQCQGISHLQLCLLPWAGAANDDPV